MRRHSPKILLPLLAILLIVLAAQQASASVEGVAMLSGAVSSQESNIYNSFSPDDSGILASLVSSEDIAASRLFDSNDAAESSLKTDTARTVVALTAPPATFLLLLQGLLCLGFIKSRRVWVGLAVTVIAIGRTGGAAASTGETPIYDNVAGAFTNVSLIDGWQQSEILDATRYDAATLLEALIYGEDDSAQQPFGLSPPGNIPPREIITGAALKIQPVRVEEHEFAPKLFARPPPASLL